MLEVEGAVKDGTWLSLEEEFTVEFDDDSARITGKGNRLVWSGGAYITVVCVPVLKE